MYRREYSTEIIGREEVRGHVARGALVNVPVRVFYGNYWARGSSRSSSTSLVTSPRAPRERVGSGDETNVARGAAECHMSFENFPEPNNFRRIRAYPVH